MSLTTKNIIFLKELIMRIAFSLLVLVDFTRSMKVLSDN